MWNTEYSNKHDLISFITHYSFYTPSMWPYPIAASELAKGRIPFIFS